MDWTFTIGSLRFGILDIVSLALILLGAIGGCAAGFSRAVAKRLGGLFCFPTALLFTSTLAVFLTDKTGLNQFFSSMVAFSVLSIVIFALFNLLGSLLGNALSAVGLGALDSILGFVAGFAFMALVVSCIVALMNYQPFIDITPLKDNSIFYTRFLEPLFPSAVDIVKGALNGIS